MGFSINDFSAIFGAVKRGRAGAGPAHRVRINARPLGGAQTGEILLLNRIKNARDFVLATSCLWKSSITELARTEFCMLFGEFDRRRDGIGTAPRKLVGTVTAQVFPSQRFQFFCRC